jgi:hypothetical protein
MKKEKSHEKTEDELEILGLDKRLLLNKINQYKAVYKEELKGIKINNSWELNKLQAILDEIQIIVQINTVDSFIMDSVFQVLLITENISSRTQNFNFSGLTAMLKMNPNFMSVCKQCFIKYGCYANAPAEFQLLVIISTTAFVCIGKNKSKESFNNFLNEPLNK